MRSSKLVKSCLTRACLGLMAIFLLGVYRLHQELERKDIPERQPHGRPRKQGRQLGHRDRTPLITAYNTSNSKIADSVESSSVAVDTRPLNRSKQHIVAGPPSDEQQPAFRGYCPDFWKIEEVSLGTVGGRSVLGKAKGSRDPDVKQKNMQKWENDIARMVNDLKLERQCQSRMTITPLNQTSDQIYCPCSSAKQRGAVEIDWSPPSWARMAGEFYTQGVQHGGTWRPTMCVPRQRIAFIIPYKNRLNHLHIFLNHLHKILTRQSMAYRVFVVEQAHPNIFNKAAMMDIGFLEAQKLSAFDCVIFHDVDMLLEDDRNLYACVKEFNVVRHIGSHVDKHNYKLPYSSLIGGSIGMTPAMFRRINGYSTSFWGWGGEDDDLYHRIRYGAKAKIERQAAALGRFTMIAHEREYNFPENTRKNQRIISKKAAAEKKTTDGLSHLNYTVHNIVERPLYTWIFAEMLGPLAEFFYWDGECATYGRRLYSASVDFIQCASRCQTSKKCRMFHMAYNAENWQPSCALFTTNCSDILSTNTSKYHQSVVYLKGRQL